MIVLSNLRLEKRNSWVYLTCDCENRVSGETTVWYAVPEGNERFFKGANYDAFLVGLLYTGMYHREDIRIKGLVTKEIYRNINRYVMAILESFSPDLKRIRIEVEGFSDPLIHEPKTIGTGFSGGVDSFSTITDCFEKEDDPEYKINALFTFNSGAHGHFSDPGTHERFLKRYNLLKGYPKEKGLPFIQVDSNIKAYHEVWGQGKSHHLILISFVLALKGDLKRYYISTAYSYGEANRFARQAVNHDLSGYAETYLNPLLSTKTLQIVAEGAQYLRTEKTINISENPDTYRYLNVCNSLFDTVSNCGMCHKCGRTLFTLESMDKLDLYAGVFDLDKWKRYEFRYKCQDRFLYNVDAFAKDNIDFARKNGKSVPPYPVALAVGGGIIAIKTALSKILNKERYLRLREKFIKRG